jgi:predicted ATPase/class 3 adenylate cyclase
MAQLPTGTVTFLFTDIEGSTRLLSEAAEAYRSLLEGHRRLIRDAVERHGGAIFGTEGDAVFAAFGRAVAALAAAADAQRALNEHSWPANRQVRVRAGVHSGEVTLTDGDYVGLALHEVARISAAAHGGQILVSGTTRELAADAGLPAAELRDLGEHRLKDVSHPVRLYQLVGDGLLDEFPSPRTLESRPNNLPEQLTSFVGRGELDEGKRLLAGRRLLTLTGPGGTGRPASACNSPPRRAMKPPTASSSCRSSRARPDGRAVRDRRRPGPASCGIVRHGPASHSARRPSATSVGAAGPGQLRAGRRGSAGRRGAAREAPKVKLIVTSRIPLRISGEQELPIPPLSVPQQGAEGAVQALRSAAVNLFVERATAARPDFRLTDENAATVVDIVRRLDGLPLAIELAAARTRVLSVQALAERLDRSLAMLTGGARDLPDRQQTLRGTIDWSYELLEQADRALFERFSVFASGACLIEAEPVCGPPAELGEEALDGLVSLSEKSLMRPVPRAVEDPRFAMLATIREYATDRLAGRSDAEALRRRHAVAYLALVEDAAPHLVGPRQRRLLDRLEQDHDNLRVALDWAVERGEAGVALRLLVGIWRFCQIRGYLTEGWERARRIGIDTDRNGSDDYFVIGIDGGLVLGGAFDGRFLSFTVDTSFNILAAFSVAAPVNGSTLELPTLASELGLSGASSTFDYDVASFSIFPGGPSDFASGVGHFDALGHLMCTCRCGPCGSGSLREPNRRRQVAYRPLSCRSSPRVTLGNRSKILRSRKYSGSG